MRNIRFDFTYPWLLLLLIPAVVLTLIPYFRSVKKYRRTRNRIIPIVLHLIVMTLSVFILSGMTIGYSVPNEENEIILLVDVSETQQPSAERRDEFIQTALRQGRYDDYRVGVVTFGYTQVYAVPLTDEIDGIYERYLAADLPDTSATNVAGALTYTKGLFSNPESAKIVLVTDGKETDNDASSVIRSVAANGIRLDVVNIASSYGEDDVQIVDVTLPDYHIGIGETCIVGVTVQSSAPAAATIELTDNGAGDASATQSAELTGGTQTFSLKHTFTSQGLHELEIRILSDGSSMAENDKYYAYLYLDVYNNILIFERKDGESEALKELLTAGNAFNVEVKNILTDTELPGTVDELRAYDQIILNNIANADMPEGFSDMLYTYVNVYGGGLLTTGGQNDLGDANAYDRLDMTGTVYQQLLPVQAIDYTPPVGVIVIIDRSGSMSKADTATGRTYLEWATEGAKSCLNALSERDYIGIMTLDDNYETILPLTRRTQEAKILAAIERIEVAEGGTVFPGAIERAGEALRAEKNVDKRHIILVTDGAVPQDQREQYEALISSYYQTDGITLSVALIGSDKDSDIAAVMQRAVDLAPGKLYPITDTSSLVRLMREDLKVPEITDVNMEPFYPIVYDASSALFNGVEYGDSEGGRKRLNVRLEGFYGVKIKSGADLLLVGEYEVPIYAQWKFGEGTVGSFMCDLSGFWSGEFMSDESGRQFILNFVSNLMPVTDIRPKEITAVLKEQNYTNRLDVYTTLNEGEYLVGRLTDVSDDAAAEISLNEVLPDAESADKSFYVTSAFSADNNYSRCNFVVKKGGVYRLSLTKYDADGNPVDTLELYKAFAYSEEYDVFAEADEQELGAKLALWAERGNGSVIADPEDPYEIFDDFVTSLRRTFDPRTAFMIVAIVLFLLDVAVRKFKFKWPHELIREYRDKRKAG